MLWRGRRLSRVGLLLIVPLQCEAQSGSPLLASAIKAASTPAGSASGRADQQPSGLSSGGRDSLLNGAVIGGAAGAALGMAFVYAVRDSDLDAGDYAYGALVFGGIGAAAGLGLDALLDRRSSAEVRPPRRMLLGPSVTRTTAGVHLIKRW